MSVWHQETDIQEPITPRFKDIDVRFHCRWINFKTFPESSVPSLLIPCGNRVIAFCEG